MRVGVIGLGRWGDRVFDEYARLRGDELDGLAACDVDEERLQRVETADFVSTTVEDVLEYADAVHICTSNRTHFPIAKAALTNGVDVLLEKPLTTDRNRAYDLVELASENGQILQTGHVFRFANVVREIRDLVESEYFGDLHYCTLRWTHDIEPVDGTDVLWDLLPHPIDILNFVTGSWPESATGTVESFRQSENPEMATVQTVVGGTPVQIQVSWVDPVRRRALEIVGSERSAIVECVDQSIEVYDGDGSEQLEVTANNTIQAEARNFIRATRTGNNTFNSAIVGARTVDTIEMIQDEVR